MARSSGRRGRSGRWRSRRRTASCRGGRGRAGRRRARSPRRRSRPRRRGPGAGPVSSGILSASATPSAMSSTRWASSERPATSASSGRRPVDLDDVDRDELGLGRTGELAGEADDALVAGAAAERRSTDASEARRMAGFRHGGHDTTGRRPVLGSDRGGGARARRVVGTSPADAAIAAARGSISRPGRLRRGRGGTRRALAEPLLAPVRRR